MRIEKKKGAPERAFDVSLRIRTGLDVVLWVGREINNVGCEPGNNEQHSRYQSHQHKKTVPPSTLRLLGVFLF
jgi:hypothetical protein